MATEQDDSESQEAMQTDMDDDDVAFFLRMGLERALKALDRGIAAIVGERMQAGVVSPQSRRASSSTSSSSLSRTKHVLESEASLRLELIEAVVESAASLLARLCKVMIWHCNYQAYESLPKGSSVASLPVVQLLFRCILGCLRVQSAAATLEGENAHVGVAAAPAPATAFSAGSARHAHHPLLHLTQSAFSCAATQRRMQAAIGSALNKVGGRGNDKGKGGGAASKKDMFMCFKSCFESSISVVAPAKANKKEASESEKGERQKLINEVQTLPVLACIMAEIATIFNFSTKDRKEMHTAINSACSTKLKSPRAPLTQALCELFVLCVPAAGDVALRRRRLEDACENVKKGAESWSKPSQEEEEEEDEDEEDNEDGGTVHVFVSKATLSVAAGTVLGILDKAAGELEALFRARDRRFSCKKGKRKTKGGANLTGHISSDDDADRTQSQNEDEDNDDEDDEDDEDDGGELLSARGATAPYPASTAEMFNTPAPPSARTRLSVGDIDNSCCECLQSLLTSAAKLIERPSALKSEHMERVMVLCTRLFRLIARLAKDLVARADLKFLPKAFMALAQTTASEDPKAMGAAPLLETLLERMLNKEPAQAKGKKKGAPKRKADEGDDEYLEGSDKTKADKARSKAKSRITRLSKVAPDLIFQMEQLDVQLIKLAETTKDINQRGFSKIIRRNTIRDFKLSVGGGGAGDADQDN
jgi:hypothetical protein